MFDFDKIIERKSDKCRKWDHAFVCSRFGDVPQGFIPLWIADMDFTSPPAVIEGFQRIVEHGTFGYTWCFDEFYDAVIAFQRKRHQVWGGDRFCMVVMWGKKGAEAMNDGGCEAR